MKKALVALVGVVVIFVVVVAMQPAGFHLERSVISKAPPAVLFDYVNDLHKMPEWSPWAAMDPNQKITYAGPAIGVGSSYTWVGEKTGEGKQTITESVPNQKVTTKLEFLKPMEATNVATFTLKPAAGGTTVTWSMDGERDFISKAFGLFVSMENMVGPQFEQGLAKLSAVSEKKASEIAAAEAKAKADAEAAAATAPTGATGPTAAKH
jgi:hypothetical protein